MNSLLELLDLEVSLKKDLESKAMSERDLIDYLLDYDPNIESMLYKALAKQSGVPFVRLAGKELKENCFCGMPEELLKHHEIIPFYLNENILHLAVENPYSIIQYSDINLYHTGKIIVYVATRSDILQRIDKYFRKDEIEKFYRNSPKEVANEEDEKYTIDDPTVRMVNSVINKGIQEKASDIHIEPKEEYIIIRFRINGDMVDYERLEKESLSKISTRIKVIGDMSITDSRKCQDGKFEYLYNEVHSMKIDIRVSIIPTIFGEKLVLRILNRHNVSLNMKFLGFTKLQLQKLEALLHYGSGMVLCCGPTGSGKSTTLYSMIEELKHKNLNITSVEDPVEYKIPAINQILVNEKANITFANTLKYVLRQDPDVIMIGEIRDPETVELAVRASITGHLVLSTLHTRNAISTITRLMDMGVEPYYINAALGGIIAQRLVKKICPYCKRIYQPTAEELLIIEEDSQTTLFYGEGCEFCNYSGSQERVLVSEVLVIDDRIKSLVLKGYDQEKFKKELKKIHDDSLQINCKSLLLKGVINIEEYKRFLFMD